MKKSEMNALLLSAASLSDSELESEYYESAYDSLGSLTDKMYELGYDIRDIEERRLHEKYLSEKADILGSLCEQRGIVLWEKS